MEKFIMADGCAIRVRESGSAVQTVLLLHGYLESIEVWDEFIPHIDKQLRVVAIDLPGHGVSEVKGPVHSMEFLARTINGALEVLGVDKCWVVGHSMGGYAALELLHLFPERVSGIVMLHSTPNADTPEKRELRQREIALVESGKKEIIARTNSSARFAPQNRKRMAARIEELTEEICMIEEDGIIALLRGMAERADNNDMLRKSGVSQLFIFGRDDEYITVQVAEKIIADHPQSKIAWLEHSGHMGFIEEPEATAEIILSFAGV